MNSALFLDLGGTLLRIENDEIYVDSHGRVEVLQNVVQTLRNVTEDCVFVITNQSGIEKGFLSREDVASFIRQVFDKVGRPVTDYWACPKLKSEFRKPSPNMILALADKHYIDLNRSVYVGDSENDRECAMSAGIASFVWAKDYFNWK